MLPFITIQNIKENTETPFSFFNKITSENSQIEEYDKCILNECLTYGILLFDPKNHSELYRLINEDYMFTNGCTGEFFYLWTLVSPKLHHVMPFIQRSIFAKPWKETPAVYDSLFSTACMHALGINKSEDPILILTDNLNSQTILIVTLDKNFLQMSHKLQFLFREISQFAEYNCSNNNTEEKISRLKDLINKHGLQSYSHLIEEDSFAGVIKKVLANLMQSPDYQNAAKPNTKDLNDAITEADQAFDSLQQKIMDIRQNLFSLEQQHNSDEYILCSNEYFTCRDAYEQLCLKQLIFAALRTSENVNLVHLGISPNINKYILPATIEYLSTSLRALSLREIFHSDVSPITIGLAKAFENEINNSVVQEMRHEHGIPMPEFFGKYCPSIGSRPFETEQLRIDLNAEGSKNCWLPPEMGRSRLAYYSNNELNKNLVLYNDNIFKKLWEEFARTRNFCAHAGHNVNQQQILEKMIELIKKMGNNNSYWRILANIRNNLK